NNSGDLILSPDHRLFIYQRRDELGVGRAEVLIKAKHLVNDDTIYQREGGFVEYFHILFDKHEIIFAEGIQAESLLVSGHTMAALPHDMANEVTARFPKRAKQQRLGAEADRSLMQGRDPAEVLRRASMGCERPSGPSLGSRRRSRKNAGTFGYAGSNHDSGML
ncbi:MAG: Hint domain-containing protein, partial [Pseudomonadota bacterium]